MNEIKLTKNNRRELGKVLTEEGIKRVEASLKDYKEGKVTVENYEIEFDEKGKIIKYNKLK